MGKLYTGDQLEEGLKELASLMKKSNYTVVLTGAGMDTESNIPDFRGKNGWWKNIDPRTVASIETIYKNYPLFYEFYKSRIKLLENVKPHKGHYILSDFEKRGIIKSIATQNISRLHILSGSQNVYELHGNITTVRCNSCGHQAETRELMDGDNCKSCDLNALRPNVVLFGEALPADAWDAAVSSIEKSDLLLVIGTSLEVSPVNHLPMVAKAKKIFINNEELGAEYDFDLRLIGKAKGILERLNDLL